MYIHDRPGGRKLMFQTTVDEQRKTNKHLKEDVMENEFVKMREERDKT